MTINSSDIYDSFFRAEQLFQQLVDELDSVASVCEDAQVEIEYLHHRINELENKDAGG